MRRTPAIVLSLLLCIALGATAFAAATPTFKQTTTPNTAVITYAEFPQILAAEDADNPESGKAITITQNTFSTTEQNVSISLPSYSKVGVYKYAITQRGGDTQGMAYDEGTIGFEVIVGYKDGVPAVLQTGLASAGGAKKDGFANEFQVGKLVLANSVSGNIADKTDVFTIQVTFHADQQVKNIISYSINDGNTKEINANWTRDNPQTFKLKGTDTLTISDIPAGVTYTLTETETNGYTPSFSQTSGTISSGGIDSVQLTNTKDASIATGVRLDSLPFVIILVIAVTGLFFLLLRRRREDEEE